MASLTRHRPHQVVFVVAAVALAGCGGDGGDGLAVPEELVGTYEAGLPEAAGAIRIDIGADRSFLITLPGRDRPFSTGPISVENEQIVLSAEQPGDCASKGTYEYRVADDRLTLTAVEDPCPERSEGLSRSWLALHAVPAAVAAERRSLEAFRSQRNAICERRSSEHAAVNATASKVGEPVALRRGGVVMRRTQAELDDLEVPARFGTVVAADRTSRMERIRLHEELADALEDHDFAAAGRLGRRLVGGNVLPNERLQDQYFLRHCP